ncbi:MAG: GerMN domain-containing protein [FCB group bacterium]|jgi:spore germination protein GerM|nr:GerMN domain-containing protein [FCB group bacterium]
MTTPRKERRLLARAGLVIWGFVTLVLLFTVVMLGMQLTRMGANPLSFVAKEPVAAVEPAPPAAETAETRQITLYFGATESAKLRTERRAIPVSTSTVENCKTALAELIKGSTAGLAPILPPETQVRSAFLMPEGELVVDLSAEAIDPAKTSASSEALLVYGVANTLAQANLAGDKAATVRKVRILIDGQPYEGHIDVSAAYLPDSSWIASASGQPKG